MQNHNQFYASSFSTLVLTNFWSIMAIYKYIFPLTTWTFKFSAKIIGFWDKQNQSQNVTVVTVTKAVIVELAICKTVTKSNESQNPIMTKSDKYCICFFALQVQHLPQVSSSLSSEQCWNLSQSSVEFMQVISPVVHLKPPWRHFQSPTIDSVNRCHKIGKQMLIINKPHNLSASSLPSMQSLSPSHTQSHGMHCRFPIEQLKLSSLQFNSTGKYHSNVSW